MVEVNSRSLFPVIAESIWSSHVWIVWHGVMIGIRAHDPACSLSSCDYECDNHSTLKFSGLWSEDPTLLCNAVVRPQHPALFFCSFLVLFQASLGSWAASPDWFLPLVSTLHVEFWYRRAIRCLLALQAGRLARIQQRECKDSPQTDGLGGKSNQ